MQGQAGLGFRAGVANFPAEHGAWVSKKTRASDTIRPYEYGIL